VARRTFGSLERILGLGEGSHGVERRDATETEAGPRGWRWRGELPGGRGRDGAKEPARAGDGPQRERESESERERERERPRHRSRTAQP
jgi:hypothetical protein